MDIYEKVIAVWFALLAFDHFVVKHFVLKRLEEHHAELWHRMGRPSVFDVLKESHWTLVGFSGDFPLLAEIDRSGPGQTTRKMILGYRALAALEAMFAVAVLLAIRAGL